MSEPLIPYDQIKISIGREFGVADVAAGGQHVGSARDMCVEHVPTGVKIILNTRSQHRSRDVGIAALEFILTHPEWR